jgi:outer membrane protein assembly factor BamD
MRRIIGLLALTSLAAGIGLSCSRSVLKEMPTPRDQYGTAMKYYGDKKYLKAQSEFQKLIFSYPGQPFIDTAQFYLAMSYYQIEDFPEAEGELRRLLQAYPSSPLAGESQYYLGMSHYRQSPRYSLDQAETYLAIDEFSVFLDKYPTSPMAYEARQRLNELYDKLARKMYKSGELYLKLHDYGPAILYFSQVRDNYPNTVWAAYAFYYTGIAQLKLGNKNEARQTFEDFVISFPDNELAQKAQRQITLLKAEVPGG